ncbi:hypothetical protein O8C86_10610 [Aliarcobacter butzleri]|uniref:putative phage abortive infection protein n=1 Tax=Aliarcobacter butzleri TaxID=28197 RepID=UPI00263DBDE1|nr:putative phage abortive infection protein [Aliarcobacter butzleri]MDN5062288.1 hypothetical protein [Aliarcobacter butzleri]
MGESKKKKDIDFLDENYLKISNALNDEERTRKSLFYIFIIALCIIGSIFLIELILVVCFYDIDKLGAFGDFFGGMINPLLTFCTFMALLMTIILQQRELKLSREQVTISVKELGETRKATELSSQALTEQAKSLKLQNFENTFFNMINLHNEIVNNLSLIKLVKKYDNFGSGVYPAYCIGETIVRVKEDFDYNGKKVLSKLFEILNVYIKDNIKTNQYKPTNLYRAFALEYNEIINHYFRNIYQIINFISINKDIENKKLYSNILRAQLSNHELALLLMNSLYHEEGDNLLKLFIQFEFMEPLNLVLADESLGNILFFSKIMDESYYNIILDDCISKDKDKKLFGKNKHLKKYYDKNSKSSSQEQQ